MPSAAAATAPVIVLHPGKAVEVLALAPDSVYATVQAHVSGRLEPVYLPDAVMFIQDGARDKQEPPPINVAACHVFAYAHDYNLGEGTVEDCHRVLGDVIVGPAVICGMEPSNPNPMGLAPATLDRLLDVIGTSDGAARVSRG